MVAPRSAPEPAGEPPKIATLREGDALEGVFACTRKERQLSRAGSPYLTVELRDATGSILGRNFRDADLMAGAFERGELVRVRARVERYRGDLQLAIQAIERAAAEEADPEAFLPASRRDIDELEGFYEHLARELFDPGLAELVRRLLGDGELRGALRRAPCGIPPSPGSAGGRARAAGVHHAYLGGLLEHTVAVASLALELCTLHPVLDRDLLLCAALVHDLGRTREFTYGADIERSEEGTLLGHIELSMRILSAHMPASVAHERRLALEHCVLTHHGPEAAAQQRFASAEAAALYRLNALDAQVKAALERD